MHEILYPVSFGILDILNYVFVSYNILNPLILLPFYYALLYSFTDVQPAIALLYVNIIYHNFGEYIA